MRSRSTAPSSVESESVEGEQAKTRIKDKGERIKEMRVGMCACMGVSPE